jgi:glycosyltransferase involved in cell wall biosynthesis
VAAKFAAADALLVTSKKGTETGPLVVKEAVVTGLPVVSVDVGDVREVLDGITPSACVPWPRPWGTAAAHARLVTALADRLAGVLATRARSNGPARRDRFGLPASARSVVDVYRDVLARRR